MSESNDATSAGLERGLGLKEATALNMIDMVGIGPFVTIPLVIGFMNGPQAIVAWIAGALLSFIDAFIWSELGAAMPKAGGTYVFLREIYGPGRWGRLMSFLFIWQTMIQAPLVIASGAIGFSQYLTYLVPLDTWGAEVAITWPSTFTWGEILQKAVSGALVLTLTVLLYRRITTIGKLSIVLWVVVVGTILWLIVGGVMNFDPNLAFAYPEGAFDLNALFFAGLGAASVKTIYSYLGYYNVCHLGGEVQHPERAIPKSMFISIAGIAVLYLAMNMSVLGVVPWQTAANSKFIFSTFVETIWGSTAAQIGTVLVLVIAFSSLFSVMLGYSRVPYAAALDGNFFKPFARVHPTKHFPHISLIALGTTAFCFSLMFKLADTISAILAMRVIIQFIGQAVGVMVLRRRWGPERFPFRMWLYPIPALLAIVMWAALFTQTGKAAPWGVGVILLGTIVYFVQAKIRGEFPFNRSEERGPRSDESNRQ